MEINIGQDYKISKKLGSGAFGQIFLGKNLKTDEEIAVKLEQLNCPVPQLIYESEIYKKLWSEGDDDKRVGFSKIYQVSSDGHVNYMVMEKLGKSLEDLFQENGKKFSIQTVLILSLQILDRIEFMHEKEIIHRDVKPDNFMMGIGRNSDVVYAIDFGLSKKYVKDGTHIQYRENKTLTGTARYASLNTHLGIEQSRRDDLECMLYCMFYFLKGTLPWMNMRSKSRKEKYDKIMEKKMTTQISTLCKDLPQEIGEVLYYVRNLDFEERPDYQRIRNALLKLKKESIIGNEFSYDWVIKEQKMNDLKKKVEKQHELRKRLDHVKNINSAGKNQIENVLEEQNNQSDNKQQKIQEQQNQI